MMRNRFEWHIPRAASSSALLRSLATMPFEVTLHVPPNRYLADAAHSWRTLAHHVLGRGRSRVTVGPRGEVRVRIFPPNLTTP